MLEKKLLLQRCDNEDIWEAVDEYIWNNWSKALSPTNDQPRYTGNRVKLDTTGITIECINISYKSLAIIARILDVKEKDCPASVPGGFVRRPEYIKVKSPTKHCKERIMLHGMDGQNFLKTQNK